MALNQTGNGREEDRERKGEKDTRSPFMVAILPRGSDHVARGSTRRRWRSKGIEGRGTTGEARVKRRVSGSTTGMVSLEGVVDRRWPTRVAILLSPGCKTYQNPVRPI